MSAAQWIERQGVRVLARGDKLRLEGLAALGPELATEVLEYARKHKAALLEELAGRRSLAWPAPVSPSGRYACLWAIASVYGAGLTKNASGGLTLTCPATMPPEAAQAAWDGLRMLETYMRGRLQ